jgi:hypothetical protein
MRTPFLYLEVRIISSLTYGFLGFDSFRLLLSSDCSSPADGSCLLSKRRVCIINYYNQLSPNKYDQLSPNTNQ